MTQKEKEEVLAFLDEVFSRITNAANHIAEQNYGLALKTLKKPYPQLKIKVDD